MPAAGQIPVKLAGPGGAPAPRRRPRRGSQLFATSVLLVLVACSWSSYISRPGSPLALVVAASGAAASNEDEVTELQQVPSPGTLGALGLLVATCISYLGAFSSARKLGAEEAAKPEAAPSAEAKKKPRIDAFDSLRFFLIAYIASGHFIQTATKNPFLLRLISQINVVVGAFFVLSGYVAAYTTTELGERKGSKRLDNAVEFAITRIMGFLPLHLLVLALFSPMFFWVDWNFSGTLVALWHGAISAGMLQAWFPLSAEVWNAPTWFLSAFAFCLCVLPYALRCLALQKKGELRRTLTFLTLLSLIPKLSYSYDLRAWGIMEGMLSSRTHPNYALFNAVRFSPFGAAMEVLMGAAACRLVMLDDESSSKSGSALLPLLAMLAIIVLRAAGLMDINDMLVRSMVFMPLWIIFLMRIHRESTGPGGAKWLPKLLCTPVLQYLGSISFPIFIVHGPIGQLFFKKAVAMKLWGGMLSTPLPFGVHWFFGVFWVAVLVSAAVLQKCFVDSAKVKGLSKSLQTAAIGTLTG